MYVGSRAIYDASGEAKRVDGVRSYAKDAHDREARRRAKAALQRQPVRLTGQQARAAALGIIEAANDANFVPHALCIMPDHVHLVMLNPGTDAKLIIKRLKAGATRRMNALATQVSREAWWVRGGWFVPLHSSDAISRAVQYVERNPLEIGLKRQRWSGIVPYDPNQFGA